jgi:hypothetical protein
MSRQNLIAMVVSAITSVLAAVYTLSICAFIWRTDQIT